MNRFIYILLGMVLFASCIKKEVPKDRTADPIWNFDWKTTQTVSLNIPTDVFAAFGTRGGQQLSTIKIYSSPLYSENSLIASGAASNSRSFETVMDLAKDTEQVYVKMISPEGLATFTTYTITGTRALPIQTGSRTFTRAGESIADKPATPQPQIPASYDVSVTDASQLSGTLTENKSYLIARGTTLSVNNASLLANWNQASRPTLYVQGALTLENSATHAISFCSLVVLDGGSVTINGRADIGWTAEELLSIYVQQGGSLTFKQGFAITSNTRIVNQGEMAVKGSEESILSNGAHLYNNGKLTIDAKRLSMSNNTMCYNTGEILTKNLAINSGSKFFSYELATMTCDNNLEIDNNCTFHNAGRLESMNIYIRSTAGLYNYGGNGSNGVVITDNLDMTNQTSKLYQHGLFTVNKQFMAKGEVDNYGRLEARTLSDGSPLTLNNYAGALLKLGEIKKLTNATFNMQSGSIAFIFRNGSNNYGLNFTNANKDEKDYALILWDVKHDKGDNAVIGEWDAFKFTGNIENYSPNKDDKENQEYTDKYCVDNAFWGGRTHNIPESEYNEGAGNTTGNQPVDKDGDGVPEGEDVDDNDPTITHISYFPSAGTWGTYIFEDLWPYMGDYDMNDIVLGFRIAYYSKGELSGENKVVRMDVEWELRAVGSQLQLACGIQLDQITPGMISKINNDNENLNPSPIGSSNNGLEEGQSKAVFALFNNPAELYGMSKGINVYKESTNTATPINKRVSIRFSAAVSKDNLLIDNINPFIVVSDKQGENRGKEIHLSTQQATDKANTTYFGQGVSSKENPYKANNGQVWAYMIPEKFRYPTEMISVTQTYPNFVKWYESAGTQHNNWYDTSISGNVVKENLYDKLWKE